jgi:hypothetical protein
MNEEFQIRENGFDEIKKAMIIKTIPIAILAAGTGLAISHFNTDGQTTDINVLLCIIPVIIGALTFGLFKGINRQKGLFESFKLNKKNFRFNAFPTWFTSLNKTFQSLNIFFY